MVLESGRYIVESLLKPIANKLKLPPTLFTSFGLILSIFAGIAFYTSHLIFGSVLVILSAGADAMDGIAARAYNKVNKRGDLLDHLTDRYADMAVLAGLAMSPYCNTTLGFFAALSVLLVSYTGTQAQALGSKRDYHGLLTRADRLVLLFLFPIIQYFTNFELWNLTLMDILMLYFIVAGNITIIQRSRKLWKDLE